MTTTTSQNTSPGLNDLVGSVALVTGATSGIGRATACTLAARGARVLVHGGTKIAASRSSPRSARRAATPRWSSATLATQSLFGPWHAAPSNSATGTSTSWSITPACSRSHPGHACRGHRRCVRRQRPHPFLLVAELAPAMAARGHGAIVNVLSTAGQLGIAGLGLYGATKARPGPADPIMGR